LKHFIQPTPICALQDDHVDNIVDRRSGSLQGTPDVLNTLNGLIFDSGDFDLFQCSSTRSGVKQKHDFRL